MKGSTQDYSISGFGGMANGWMLSLMTCYLLIKVRYSVHMIKDLSSREEVEVY